MKKLTQTLFLLLLVSCGGDSDNTAAKAGFLCDYTTDDLLETVAVGQNISYSTKPKLKDLFKNNKNVFTYTSGSYCSKSYSFSQFNTDTYDWCYYYSIDTDCSGFITSVYRGE